MRLPLPVLTSVALQQLELRCTGSRTWEFVTDSSSNIIVEGTVVTTPTKCFKAICSPRPHLQVLRDGG